MLKDIRVPFDPLCKPYPHAAKALVEFINTGTVTLPPNPAAEQLVALRLEMDELLMRDPIAREVVARYVIASPPTTIPRHWSQTRRTR